MKKMNTGFITKEFGKRISKSVKLGPNHKIQQSKIKN